MNYFRQIIPSLVLSIGASLGLVNVPAIAFTVTQNNNPSALQNALLGNDPSKYTRLSNFQINLVGDARAYGTFTDDPFGLGSAVALSTGRVEDLAGANSSSTDLKTDLGLPGVPGDSISLILSFDVAQSVDQLYFQYVFGSEELPEYGGSPFNDAFYLYLNGVNYATLSNGDQVTVNHLAGSPNGPFSPDLILNPPGTGPAKNVTRLDGYTAPLLFTAPVAKGQKNTLVINIADSSDGIYDSGVFIKAGTLGSVCPTGAICNGNATPNTTSTTTPVTTPSTTPVTTPDTTMMTTPVTTPSTTPVTTPDTTMMTTPVTTPSTTPNPRAIPESSSSPLSFLAFALAAIGLALSHQKS